MADARFFIDAPHEDLFEVGSEQTVVLTAEDAHHALRVLRIKPGEYIELVLRDTWQAFRVKVVSCIGEELVVRVEERITTKEPTREVTLVFGLSKGDKNDTIVRQAVEIGARRIVPVIFNRSIVRLDSEKSRTRGERLRSKARSAAMQAHRSCVPEVLDPAVLTSHDELFNEKALLLVLWEEEREAHLVEVLKRELSQSPDLPITLVVGPEGGISHEEIEYLCKLGAHPASLGDSILRVDTANAVALGITQAFIRSQR